MSTVFSQKVLGPWSCRPWCCRFLALILRGSEVSALSHCVLHRYMEVSWLSPAATPAPGHSCHPWQLSDGFLTFFFGGVVLSTQLATGKETSCPVLGSVAPTSPLRHKDGCVHAWVTHLSPWSEVSAAVEHLGCVQHSCPLAMMSCLAGLSHSCHVRAGFISLHHRAKAAWSQTLVLGSLSPRLSVCSALCSCDNQYLLWKGKPVL